MGDTKPPPDFDDSDRAALEHAKAELQESRHRQWLWQLIKRATLWLVGLIGGLTLALDGVAKLWKLLRETIQ